MKDKKRELAYNYYASKYDNEFEKNKIGIITRNRIQSFIKIFVKQGIQVLDLGSGTGNDTLLLANLNCNVDAFDISEKMHNVTKKKVRKSRLGSQINFIHGNINNINITKKYDFILVNFGVINFVDDLVLFKKKVESMLTNNGIVFIVSYNDYCIWEKIYLTLINHPNRYRRNHKNIKVNISNVEIIINPYNPIEIEHIFSDGFTRLMIEPVNSFIPPAFMINSIPNLLINALVLVESIPIFPKFKSMISDYFIAVFRKYDI